MPAAEALVNGTVAGSQCDFDAAPVAALLEANRLTIATAESLTGGLLANAFAKLPGASGFYRGGVVAYASGVKFDLLGVTPGPVVNQRAAEEMATGVRRLLDADLGLAVTGVGGPGPEEGRDVGTVFVALAVGSELLRAELHLPGDPAEVCAGVCGQCLGLVRRALERPAPVT